MAYWQAQSNLTYARRRGGLIVQPTVRVGTKAGPESRNVEGIVRDLLWSAISDTSRIIYWWLTGNTNKYPRSFARIKVPAHPEFQLPDTRKTGAYHPPGAPHLIDSVYITEDKRDLRSTVTHSQEAYWAYFVEFGRQGLGPNPRWIPAANEARRIVSENVLAYLRESLNSGELSLTGRMTPGPDVVYSRL